MIILSKILFPHIDMGGSSKLLGYINMQISAGPSQVISTQGLVIIQINQGLHTEYEFKEEMDHESLLI